MARPLDNAQDELKQKQPSDSHLKTLWSEFYKAYLPAESQESSIDIKLTLLKQCLWSFIQKIRLGQDEELWDILTSSNDTRGFNIFIIALCDVLSESLEHIAELKSHQKARLLRISDAQHYFTSDECAIAISFITLLTDHIHVPLIRTVIFRIFGLSSWQTMSTKAQQTALETLGNVDKLWQRTVRLFEKAEELILSQSRLDFGTEQLEKAYLAYQSKFFLTLWIDAFFAIAVDAEKLDKCLALSERTLECFSTCLSLLSIRRTLKPVFDAVQLISRLAFTPVATRCHYFFKRLDEVDSYDIKQILGGEALSKHIGALQRFAFSSKDPELQKVAEANVKLFSSSLQLTKLLKDLPIETLKAVLEHLGISSEISDTALTSEESFKTALLQVAVHHITRQTTWPQRLTQTAVLPNEKDIWEGAELFRGLETTADPVPLPRMGLQYLNIQDFFLRSFDLYRAEILYGIQQDLEKTIFLMKPQEPDSKGIVKFAGASRMGAPVNSFAIVSIGQPRLGTMEPTEVWGEIILDLKEIRYEDRKEWDALRSGDLVFLVSLGPHHQKLPDRLADLETLSNFPETYGLLGVRVAEVQEVVDTEGTVISSAVYQSVDPVGTKRTFRVMLDTLQYQQDLEAMGRGELFMGFYESFNLLVRRKPETNNFKGVLQCLKTLALTETDFRSTLNEKLYDALLGYGDMKACSAFESKSAKEFIAYNTFVDLDHLVETCSDLHSKIQITEAARSSGPPYKLSIGEDSNVLHVTTASLDPKLKADIASRPPVRYTRAQIRAIKSGMGEGISVIVGPPGTGKTDTAVQIVHQLMLNYPSERILIVAKTNQALNDFFTKIVELGIDEKYLLRLGFGERELEAQQADGTRKEFSKWGRVEFILRLRADLLERMNSLLRSMQESSCYTDTLASMVTYLNWALPVRQSSYQSALRSCVKRIKEVEDLSGKQGALKDELATLRKISPWLLYSDEIASIQARLDAPNESLEPGDGDEDEDMEDETIGNMNDHDLLTSPQGTEADPRTLQMEETDKAAANTDLTAEDEDKMADTNTSECVTEEAMVEMKEDSNKDTHQEEADQSAVEGGHREPVLAPEHAEMLENVSQSLRADLQFARMQVNEVAGASEPQSSSTKRKLRDYVRSERRKKRCELLSRGQALIDAIFSGNVGTLALALFPFNGFDFAALENKSLESCATLEEVDELTEACIEEVRCMIRDAKEVQAFELLRSVSGRTEFMLTKFSRIVAMTSTHAALSRDTLCSSNFQYTTLIVEEAAQILDAENVIATLLQPKPNLKRILLFGDHLQLKPIIQNRSLQQTCNFDQSLFCRLIQLGFPYIQLDAQGRCRKELADIFRWRYQRPPLLDLPLVSECPEFLLANPGLAFHFQFVDVEKGEERCTAPHYYQNEAEASMVVALYCYMRLIGYPAKLISVLTFYNGQKDLLRKMFRDRCESNPLLGMPSKITTVDKFQGQQNDYVIMSMVRTKYTSYLGDLRRLTVAFSRARLGLYLFGKYSMVKDSAAIMSFLCNGGNDVHKLALLPNERWDPSEFERKLSTPTRPLLIQSVNDIWAIVKSILTQSLSKST